MEVAQPLLDDEVSDDLAVCGGLEDRALALQLPAEGVGVGEVSVMGQGHAALVVVHQDGLDVALVVAAGGAVADVAHSDAPLPQGGKALRAEDIPHQTHVPVGPDDPVVVDGDAGTLLPPVLEGVEGIVGKAGDVSPLRQADAEDAALFVEVTVHVTHRHGPGGGA